MVDRAGEQRATQDGRPPGAQAHSRLCIRDRLLGPSSLPEATLDLDRHHVDALLGRHPVRVHMSLGHSSASVEMQRTSRSSAVGI